MIKRRVDILPHSRLSLNIDNRKRLLPHRASRGTRLIEVKPRHLSIHVRNRILFTRRRQRHLHNQRLRCRSKIKHANQPTPFNRLRIPRPGPRRSKPLVLNRHRFTIVKRMSPQRLRESNRKIKLSPRSPPSCLPHTRHRAIRAQTDARPQHLARIVIDRRPQIHQQMRRNSRGKRIAMNANPRRRRHLSPHLIVVQRHRVVARLSLLRLMPEPRAIARASLIDLARLQPHLTRDRLYQHIAKIRMPRAGKVSMRKPQDRRVFIPITRRPLIALLEGPYLRIRAKLHHAKRNCRPRKRMPLRPRPNHRVDRRVRITRLSNQRTPCRSHQRQRRQQAHPQSTRSTHHLQQRASTDALRSHRRIRNTSGEDNRSPSRHDAGCPIFAALLRLRWASRESATALAQTPTTFTPVKEPAPAAPAQSPSAESRSSPRLSDTAAHRDKTSPPDSP